MSLPFLISLFFSPLAALAAFLITYDEYSHHFADKRTPFVAGLEAGVVAFAFFTLASFLIGWLVPVYR